MTGMNRVGRWGVAFAALCVAYSPVCDALSAAKPIDRDQSMILLEVAGVDADRVRYFDLGWSESYEYQTHAVLYRGQRDRSLMLFFVHVLAPDYYWSSAGEVSAETIRKLWKGFRDVDISIGRMSPGFDSQTDDAAARPGYLHFRAGPQACVYLRRISSMGEINHGITKNRRTEMGIYCAPGVRNIPDDDVAKLLGEGVKFIAEPPGKNGGAKVTLRSFTGSNEP